MLSLQVSQVHLETLALLEQQDLTVHEVFTDNTGTPVLLDIQDELI